MQDTILLEKKQLMACEKADTALNRLSQLLTIVLAYASEFM